MNKIHFEQNRGRATHKYPQQVNYQPQYVDIHKDGQCYFDWNAEIGHAVPVDVWNKRIIRITFNVQVNEMMRQSDRKDFFRDNKDLFQRIVNGLDEKWDGNNYKGILTDDAAAAYEQLQRIAEDFYPA